MKIICYLSILTIFQTTNTLIASGQDSTTYNFSTVRINGLVLDKYYTIEQIIEALGEPDKEDNVVYSYFVYYTTKIMTPASNRIESDFNIARRISDGIGFGGQRQILRLHFKLGQVRRQRLYQSGRPCKQSLQHGGKCQRHQEY